MKVQQAIFTSSERGLIKGYQLVGKSEDIDRSISKELHRWSPSHLGNDDPTNWTINYYPVSDDHVAVSRTVLGEPEYSGRGCSQVVTMIAVLTNEQFAAYGNNAMLLAKTALALGWLRLPGEVPSRLDAFELPDCPLAPETVSSGSREMQSATQQASPWRDSEEDLSCVLDNGDCNNDGSHASLLSELTGLLSSKKRIAIIGAPQPKEMAADLILLLPIPERREFSFTTGLPPALHRPFRAHFLPSSTPVLNQMLKSEGVTVLQSPLAMTRA